MHLYSIKKLSKHVLIRQMIRNLLLHYSLELFLFFGTAGEFESQEIEKKPELSHVKARTFEP